MIKIRALKVVIANSATSFEDSLAEQVNNMQVKGLVVTINNPHVNSNDEYTAIVEGRIEIGYTSSDEYKL